MSPEAQERLSSAPAQCRQAGVRNPNQRLWSAPAHCLPCRPAEGLDHVQRFNLHPRAKGATAFLSPHALQPQSVAPYKLRSEQLEVLACSMRPHLQFRLYI
jgi:hypothetical protein